MCQEFHVPSLMLKNKSWCYFPIEQSSKGVYFTVNQYKNQNLVGSY